MIAYNKAWLYHLELHDQLNDEYQSECITTDEVNAVKSKYPASFYTPGIFVRVGLFILTFIIVLFSAGILNLMLENTPIAYGFGWLIFLSGASYIALEIIVKAKKHYQSGVDDALLLLSVGFLMGGVTWMTYDLNPNNQHIHYLSISLAIFILSTYFTLRFINLLMCTIASLSFFALVFFSWRHLGVFNLYTIPLVMMLISALIYWLAASVKTTMTILYYKHCIIIIKVISLVILYAAGNYFVADKLSNRLSNSGFAIHSGIPFGLLFWGWTMFLPVLYAGWGIYKKNAVLLRIGLLLTAVGIATFRNYYHVLSIELVLIVAGVILLAIVYVVIKYLKKDKHGFTYTDINQTNLLDKIKLESLIISETLGHTSAPVKPTERFGGGDFGGGGSGGAF